MIMSKAIITGLLVGLFCPGGLTVPVQATALDDYISAADPAYRYHKEKIISGEGYTAHVLNMTSQRWRCAGEVDRTLWQHWLTIVVPDKVSSETAMLLISGGSNKGGVPSNVPGEMVFVATKTKSIVAEVKMVPNQPLVFPDGGGPRYKDAIIAYTFDKYYTTGDGTWPLLLPMVKSAVRGMDTVQAYIGGLSGGPAKPRYFVVGGASKRGWTTWLTGAVDKRVKAIIPLVIDVLNLDEQMTHHYGAYGYYADAIHDYVEKKIMGRMNTPQGQALLKIVDPYEYRGRYTMPKYGMNSTGDQFFVPDSAQFYFAGLPGEKHLRYVPNTDHGLSGKQPYNNDAVSSLTLFYYAILKNVPRPRYSWSVKGEGRIDVQTQTPAKEVRLWQATNPKARNFRLDSIGTAWTHSVLSDLGGGRYIGEVAKPKQGWRAFFVEMIFASGTKEADFKFTTEVRVVPEKLPFACNFDGNGKVNPPDMATFLTRWLSMEPTTADMAFRDGDRRINHSDFAAPQLMENP